MGRFSLAQIKSIHVQFNHIDPRSRCVREFLARCTAPKALESNPKCEISSKGRIDEQPPVVVLEYGACPCLLGLASGCAVPQLLGLASDSALPLAPRVRGPGRRAQDANHGLCRPRATADGQAARPQ